MSKDYYNILGVDKKATREDIKKAYKKLAKKYHPDVNKDSDAEAKFKEVNEAASILGDDKKRQQYDQFGTADFSGFQGGQGGFGFSGGNFDFGDLFDGLFGGGFGGRSRGPRRGSDLRYDLDIELEDAFNGAEKTIIIPRFEQCSSCDGIGAKSQSDIITCSSCNGSGQIRRTQRTPFGLFQTSSTCGTCRGQGQEIKAYCPVCDGDGRVEKHRKIKVEIPEGVEEGTTLRISREGEAGEKNAPTGDLYVVLSLNPHKIFERKGSDLFLDVPVSFVGMTLGDTIEIPTIDGKAKLKIPPGSQSGTLFKMKGKGMPHLKRSGEGDQYVKTTVYTPSSLNKSQKESLKKFAKDMGDKISPSKGFLNKLKDQFKI